MSKKRATATFDLSLRVGPIGELFFNRNRPRTRPRPRPLRSPGRARI